MRRHKETTYWVSVPLTLTYRSRSHNEVIASHTHTLDLPILDFHLQYVKKLVTEMHMSDEQALFCIIQECIDDKADAFNTAHPDCSVEITLSGLLTYNKTYP